MSTPSSLVYDLPIPRRPNAYDDVGGGAKTDDPNYPPDPVTMVTSADANQWAKLLVAYSKVTPSCVLYCQYTASPSSYQVSGLSAAGNLVTASMFSFVINSMGNITVSWPPNTFPPSIVPPAVFPVTTGDAIVGNGYPVYGNTTNVTLYDVNAGYAVNVPFVLMIF